VGVPNLQSLIPIPYSLGPAFPQTGAPDLAFETWVYNLHSPYSVPLYVRTSHSSSTRSPGLWARAFLVSLPLEAINYWVIGYPADTHSVSRAAQYAAVALQWYLLHLPGIIAGDHSVYLREHHPILAIVLFLTGLIDTALVILLILWLAGLARRTLRKLSSPQKQTA